jgi:hypothetical protein
MKEVGNKIFDARDGETVFVVTDSSGTAHLVNYSLNGNGDRLKKGQALSFKLDKNVDDVWLLTLGFTFSNNAGGGNYNAKVTGSDPGSDSDDTDIPQNGQKVDSIFYVFRIK